MQCKQIGWAVLPLLFAPGHAAAAAPDWQVTEISGAVSVGAVGRVHPIARGGFLKAGDIVSTGIGARAVLTRGEEYVVISPASRLRLPEAAESGGGVMQWIEDFGTAVFRIQKMATPHFGVQTQYLAAVVKGTTFSVTVGATGASVQVVEGAVEVATADGGAAELIRPGVIASVRANDRYRLTVDGDTHHIVSSPNAPAEATKATGSHAIGTHATTSEPTAPLHKATPLPTTALATHPAVIGIPAETAQPAMPSVISIQAPKVKLANTAKNEALADTLQGLIDTAKKHKGSADGKPGNGKGVGN